MPVRKKSSRRPMPRRRRRRLAKTSIAPPKTYLQNYGVPQVSRRKLTYSTTVTLSSAASAIANQKFTGNGIYDPDVTGVGHQPYGYDQLSLIYSKYRVISAKCHVDIVNNGTQTSIQHVGVLAAKSAVFPTTALSTIYEKSRGKNMAMFGANSRDRLKTSVSASTKAIWAVKDISDDEDFQGLTGNTPIGANPVNSWYFHVFNQSISGTTTGVVANVVIEYYVEFFNPIIADSS